jgi:translation initiation factor 3 subunit A
MQGGQRGHGHGHHGHHAQSQKPEYVLKRANDLINSANSGTSNGEEKRWALELLHGFIGAKKKLSQWSKEIESIMKRHVELCIDLKNHHFAKDGLHQYRNLCQQLDPASLETVILHLLDRTEAQAGAARSRVQEGAALISDLDEAGESPESLLMSSMTEESDKERSTRELVVPWLKFLWETYRAVLELLHKMPKLEKVYHKTCEKAFKFCLDYERKIEFKRLCDMLRLHLASLQKNAATPTAARTTRNAWDWTPEAVDLHLQTRFLQLETATSLDLWNEGFRTLEDIYSIMVAGRKTSRPKLMSVYYEKLTRIFWVSENHLFHAYASFRYYNLVSEFRRDFKPDERSILASSVLLSALSVPSLRDAEAANASPLVLTNVIPGADDDDVATEKQQQIAALLDFQANPTRKSLLAEIVAKGVVGDVLPELSGLFDDMETRFQPLTLTKNIVKAITHIKSIPQLAVYAVPLQRVAVFKVVQQLSKVYDVVKLSFLRKILEGLEDISPNLVERIMIDGVIRKQLQLRIDHVAQVVRFGASVVNETLIVENQVQFFGSKLQEVSKLVVGLSRTPEIEQAKVSARREFLATMRSTADKEHTLVLERRNIIEQRKIEVEKVQEERERITILIAEAEQARLQAEEQARLDKERLVREAEKAKVQQEKDECKKIRMDLHKLGVVYEEADLLAMPAEKRNGLVAQAMQDAMKAKDDQERKLLDQAKKLDHITRALRIESAEVIKQKHVVQAAQDAEKHQGTIVDFIANSKIQHQKELVEKKRWEPLQIHKAYFDQVIVKAQRSMYDAELDHLKMKALQEHRTRKVLRARQMWDEELQRIEEEEELAKERRDKEERDRIEAEQYEMLRRQRADEEEAERSRVREKELQAKSLEQARLAKLAEAKRLQQETVVAPTPAPAPAPASSWSRTSASATSGDARAAKPSFEKSERGFGDRSERPERSERGFGDRSGPERSDRGFGDRAGPERADKGFGDRAGPERSERGFGDRSGPERSERGFGERSGPERSFGDRSSAEKTDRGFGDRSGPERSDRGGFERGAASKESGNSWSRGTAPQPRTDSRPADSEKWRWANAILFNFLTRIIPTFFHV